MGLSESDYLSQWQALLPAGPAWPRDDDASLTKLLGGLAAECAKIDARANNLIAEADPRETRELLAEWETAAGLPDTCDTTVATTLQERRTALVAKLTALGGASRAYFIAMAAAMGYEITIDEFRPFICGKSQCGDTLDGAASVRHTWRVNVAGARYTPFRAGASQCGDSLGKLSRAEDLECKLNQIKPAHTTLIVSYEGV